MKNWFAANAETATAVGHHALALRRPDALAQICLAAQAKLALPAFGRVERDDMVALAQGAHAGADVDDDAGALVAEDRRKDAFRVGARERVVVGVANAGGLDFDEHPTGPRPIEIDALDKQRGA